MDVDNKITNHDEAWSLACLKRENSNMARCYIEAIEALRTVHSCGNGGARLSRLASDKVRAILKQIGAGETPAEGRTE